MGVVYGISTGFTTVFLVSSHAVIDRLWEENEILMLRLMLLFQLGERAVESSCERARANLSCSCVRARCECDDLAAIGVASFFEA